MEAIRDDIQVLMSRFPGFGFNPTDVELVGYYLKNKLQGQNNCTDLIIPELDIVKFDPWDLPGKAVIESDKEWFYFNTGVRKFAGYTRKTEHGYWMQIGTESLVGLSPTSNPVGVKRTLVFFTGLAPQGVKTLWIMHELSMINHPKDSMSVCRLIKNTDSNLKDINPNPNPNPNPNLNTEFEAEMVSEDSDGTNIIPQEGEFFYGCNEEEVLGRPASWVNSFTHQMLSDEDSYDQQTFINGTIENEGIPFFDTHDPHRGEFFTGSKGDQWLGLPPSYPLTKVDHYNGELLINMMNSLRKEKGRNKRQKKFMEEFKEKFKEMEMELKGNSHQQQGE